jgi:hypothetical protein
MGQSYEAICSKCGETFMIPEGGGFYFHRLHCNKCGTGKDIGFDDLGEIHLRYIKESPSPYCIASWESDKKIKETF